MRLAIIGCGDAASAVALASRFVRGVRVTVCVDTDIRRAARLARFHRARVSADWRTLLSAEDVDAVYVAVPHNLHADLSLELQSKGLPVLLEKPLAESVISARRLIAGLRGDSRVGVNYQFRYDPKAWALVRHARAGTLGSLSHITVDVPWFRKPAYLENASWHGSREASGGGTLLTQGSHALDIALLCADSPGRTVTARTYRRVFKTSEVEDLASALIDTESGVPVMVTSSMVSRPGFPVTVAVYGSKGAGIYRGPAQPRLSGHGVHLSSPVAVTQLHSYVAAIAGFRDWVAGSGEYRCPAESALPVLEVIEAAYLSAESDRVVAVGDTYEESEASC